MRPRIKQKICPNCQTALETEENFCPTCGQENREIMLPAMHLLKDLTDTMFNLDSRFFKTLWTIFRFPGRITKEYNEGKRKRYAPPLRIYLVASLFFFLLLGVSTRPDLVEADNVIMESIDSTSQDSMTFNLGTGTVHLSGAEIYHYRDYNKEQLDSALLAKGVEPSFFNKLTLRQTIKILDSGGVEGFTEQMLQNFSIGMFFLMPVFGLIMWLFFMKKRRRYIYHLIFSIHIHSIAFLIYAIEILISMAWDWKPLESIFNLGILLYFILSMKNVYHLKWGETLWKFLAILISYLIIAVIALAIITIISLMTF